MNNTYRLKIDIKKPMNNIIPTFVQYDNAELQIELYDNGQRIKNISAYDATVSHRLPNGEIYIGGATVKNESVSGETHKFLSYVYKGSEMKEAGIVETMASFKVGSAVLSTLPFNVRMIYNMNDESAKEAISETGYMGQLIQKIEVATNKANESSKYAKEQGDYAKKQAQAIGDNAKYAKEQGDYAKSEREKIIKENQDLTKIKTDAKNATQKANSSATYATTQGEKAAEQVKRVQPVIDKSEKLLKEAENATTYAKTQGDYAKTQTSKIIQENQNLSRIKEEAIDATKKANNSSKLADSKANFADTQGKYAKEQGDYAKEQGTKTKERTEYLETLLPNIEGWEFKGEWDKNVSYEKHNIVTFNGATYILLNDEEKNKDYFPNTSKSWHLLAQRGLDGEGSVRSVNYFLPDQNGNVNLQFLFDNLTVKRNNFVEANVLPADMKKGIYAFYTTGYSAGYPTFGTVFTVLGDTTAGGQQYLSSTSGEEHKLFVRSVLYGEWTDWVEISISKGVQAQLQSIENKLNKHLNNRENPHNVTKEQVGLDNVENVQQATKKEFDTHVKEITNKVDQALQSSGVTSVQGDKGDVVFDSKLHNDVTWLKNNAHLPEETPNQYPEGVTVFKTTIQDEWDKLVGVNTDARYFITTYRNRNINVVYQKIVRMRRRSISNTNFDGMWIRTAFRVDLPWSDPIRVDATSELELYEKHLNDTNNPHNVTAEQVTMIKPKKATELMDTYPDGVTMFYYEEEEAEGYPHRIGTILTAKGVDKTAFQLFARNGFNKASEYVWYRTGHITKGWSKWYQIANDEDMVELTQKIENIDSQEINTLADNYLSSSAPLNDYPKGITTFYKNTTSDVDETNLINGYPQRYGQVVTFFNGSTTGMQLFTKNNFNSTRRELYIRYWHFNKQWSRWYKLLDDRVEEEIKQLKQEVSELRNAIIQLGGKL